MVSASPGSVTYSMEVSEEHLNPGKTLHGGLTATIVDHVSTMAIMAGDNPPGVSIDISVRLVYLLCLMIMYNCNYYIINYHV